MKCKKFRLNRKESFYKKHKTAIKSAIVGIVFGVSIGCLGTVSNSKYETILAERNEYISKIVTTTQYLDNKEKDLLFLYVKEADLLKKKDELFKKEKEIEDAKKIEEEKKNPNKDKDKDTNTTSSNNSNSSNQTEENKTSNNNT